MAAAARPHSEAPVTEASAAATLQERVCRPRRRRGSPAPGRTGRAEPVCGQSSARPNGPFTYDGKSNLTKAVPPKPLGETTFLRQPGPHRDPHRRPRHQEGIHLRQPRPDQERRRRQLQPPEEDHRQVRQGHPGRPRLHLRIRHRRRDRRQQDPHPDRRSGGYEDQLHLRRRGTLLLRGREQGRHAQLLLAVLLRPRRKPHQPDLAHAARDGDTAPFVLGGGSNTLADDAGYPGTVVRMATRRIAVRLLGSELVEVIAQAGEPLGSLVAFTVAEGLSGIEYLGGIPGTTGAAPVQNTGAYGQKISDTLTRLTVHDWDLGRTRELHSEDCDFGYRTRSDAIARAQRDVLSDEVVVVGPALCRGGGHSGCVRTGRSPVGWPWWGWDRCRGPGGGRPRRWRRWWYARPGWRLRPAARRSARRPGGTWWCVRFEWGRVPGRRARSVGDGGVPSAVDGLGVLVESVHADAEVRAGLGRQVVQRGEGVWAPEVDAAGGGLIADQEQGVPACQCPARTPAPDTCVASAHPSWASAHARRSTEQLPDSL